MHRLDRATAHCVLNGAVMVLGDSIVVYAGKGSGDVVFTRKDWAGLSRHSNNIEGRIQSIQADV